MKLAQHVCLWIALSLSPFAFAQKPKTDLQRLHVAGKAKSIKISEYTAKDVFGKPTKDALQSYVVMNFNADGNAIEQNFYKADGTLRLKTIQDYNSKKEKINTNTYNNKGELVGKYVGKHDANSFLIEEKSYDEKGTCTARVVYKYDNTGNIIEQATHVVPDEGEVPSSEVSKYDASGYLVEKVFTSEFMGKNKQTVTYTNDAYGNMTQFNMIIKNTETGKVTMEDTYKYTYQYNEKNDWTIQIQYRGEASMVKGITEREITYYE